MEAARIPWRPLGRILVEQGLLTSEELETALEQQERTGKRLGEMIVECGFVSGPELSSALASQYGIELTTETGFGTGLRGQIQRRHESERRSARPTLVDASTLGPDFDDSDELPEDIPQTTPAEASLLAQLEEQWAKLAAAEAMLAEQEQELAAAAGLRDRRREQAVRFARAARARTQAPAAGNDDGLRAHCALLEDDIRTRDEQFDRLKQENAHAHDRRAALEQSLAESQAELAHARGELAGAHEAVTSAQAAIADQERRHHELGSEFERVVHARAEVDQSLASAHADLDERTRRIDELQEELAQAHGALAAAEAAIDDQNRRLGELGTELERVVESRTALEQGLADVSHQRDRRREQAERLARRARARVAREDNELRDHLGSLQLSLSEREAELDDRNRRIDELHEELTRAYDATAAVETTMGEQNRRLNELGAELERVAHSRTELEHELAEARAQHDRVGAEDHEDDRNRLASLEQSLSEREHALHDLARKLDRRRAQAIRLAGRLRSLRRVDDQQLSQIERLVADVRGCDVEIARLRSENERTRAQTRRFVERLRHARAVAEAHPEPKPPDVTSHLVFVQLPDRYELVERPGPPPARRTAIELPDVDLRLVVAGSRRSPLPNDARPCVVGEASVTSDAE